MIARIVQFVKQYWHDLFVLGCITCIAIISYNLGHIRALKQPLIKIGEGANIYQAASSTASPVPGVLKAQPPRDQRVVVSKNSTSKKYHYASCASGKKILPENQIWFDTETLAQQAGYTLAGNCQP